MQENRKKIYDLIYEEREIAKQSIALQTGLSLPTVTKNLQSLLHDGLITKGGTFSSTGGRPAEVYRCAERAGIAVGVEMTADQLCIASVDLYGMILKHQEYKIAFVHEASYYQLICSRIRTFIKNMDIPSKAFLGVTIAVQGIVSSDGSEVLFSGLLHNAGIRWEDFARYLDVPFELVHDAEAAGYAELWQYSDVPNALYISLNRYMGSAMILNGRLLNGFLGAGTAEHMTMVQGGRECYCGNTGCADTILGLRYLEEEINMSVEQLFTNLRYHDPDAEETMHSYLKRLAVLIRNVQMIASCDVIIGGYLENFLTPEEYEYLEEQLKQMRLLQGSTIRIIPGHYADHAAVVGAGLIRVRRFLDAV